MLVFLSDNDDSSYNQEMVFRDEYAGEHRRILFASYYSKSADRERIEIARKRGFDDTLIKDVSKFWRELLIFLSADCVF